MADTIEDVQAQGGASSIAGLPTDVFDNLLIAISAGENVEEALNAVRESMREAAIDAGASTAAADQAADVFLETFQNEVFLSNRAPRDAVDYAEQAMQQSIDTFDAAQGQSPADALLAAIASGQGVEEAVSRVVGDMIANGDAPQAPAAIEAAFLSELQESLAQGSSPQAALDSASVAADAQLTSQQQASVPVENSILSSLANGDNVGDALSDAARLAGGDANAFADNLEAALSQGMGADDALADATQAATDTAAAKQAGEVDLDAAGRLAQSLAQGENVANALQEAGGGEAFAATLEQSLAAGNDAGQALAEADSAQQQQDANADAQSVPLSAADKLAAALANGADAETLAQLSGNSDFADALEQSLASGESPVNAMNDAQQAAQEAAAVAQAQDVPLSPADQLAASLASGDNVDDAMANAGQGDAFGEELISSLADGQAPGDALAGAADAQQAADTTSQNQSVPSDPAATALAQGGDAAKDVNLAQAVADATGTTGGETTDQGSQTQAGQEQAGQEQAGQDQAGQQQTADGAATGDTGTSQPAATTTADSSGQPSGGNTGPATSQQASTDQAAPQQTTSDEEAAPSQETQQQVASEDTKTETGEDGADPQTESDTAESVEQVAQGPGEGENSDTATGDDEATGQGVTETIQVADAGTGTEEQGNTQNQTEDPAPEGGGSDQPTDEEIAALQEIESAAGGNTNTNNSSPRGPNFENNLNPGPFGNTTPSYTPSSFGPSTTTTPTRTTSQTTSQDTAPTQTTTPVNLNPIVTSDTGAGTENQTLSLSVLSNDYDPDGQPLTITAASVPQGKGTVQIAGPVVTFNPGTDFDDLDAGDTESITISYTVSDGVGGSASSTVSVVVTGTNDVPVIDLADSTVTGAATEATDNAEPGDPDLTAAGELKFIDVDADGTHTVNVTPSFGVAGILTAAITTPAVGATGTVSWDYTVPEGSFDYLTTGETATEVFRVTVTDDQGTTAFQDITVTITGTNDSPIAVADVSSTSENTVKTIDVIANDTDVDNATASLSLTAASVAPGQGTVSIVGNQIQYNPGTDFESLAVGQHAVVQISYTVTDPGGLTSVSTVDVTVNGSNDVPLVAGPIAVAPVTEDSGSLAIDLLTGASDIDDGTNLDTASVAVTSDDGHIVSFSIDNDTGQLTINSSQFGYLDDGEQVALSVTYNVVDGDGGSVPNTASVVVTGANDAPRFVTTGVTITNENFESGANGWSDTTVTTVDGLTQFLGNFGQGGATEKAFIIPNGANGVSFSFDFYEMDSWDDETFTVSINGDPILQKVFGQVGDQSDANFTLKTLEDADLGLAAFNDQVYGVRFSLSAAQLAAFPDDGLGNKIVTLGFSSTLNQEIGDESWGVDNLRISTNVSANAAGFEDTTIAINGLKVGDVDGDDLTVTVDVPDGILDLTDGGAGATLQNSGSTSVTVSGTAAQINAALATLTYTPEDNANGLVPVSLSVNDGTVTTNSSFDIIVAPIEDATVISAPEVLNVTGVGSNGDDASFSFAIAENFNTFPTTQGTVELWLKTADQAGAVASYAVPGSANELWITLTGGDINIWLNNTNLETITTVNVTDDAWHHLALSFGPNGGDTVFYVDGNPVATLPATAALEAGGTLVLGADQDAVGGDFQSSQALDGQIDGVRIWDSVRSQAEINAVMGQELDPAMNPDLIADYRMDGSMVSAVDGAPDLVLNNASLTSGGVNAISGLEDQPISLADIDIANVDGDVLTVTLTSAQGSISANAGGGGAFIVPSGNGVSITGLAVDVRAAMDTASFTGDPGFFGTANVDITVNDGGVTPVVSTVAVQVQEIPNVAPIVTAVQNSTGALIQDGVDSKSTIAHSAALDFGGATPMSVELRIKTSDDVNRLQTLFDKSDTNVVDSSPFRLHMADGAIRVWNVSVEPSTPPNILQPNTWYDIGVTYDGANLKIYIDGILMSDAPFTMGPSNDSPWNIGDDNIGSRDFQGLIDDLRVWDVALSEEEIQSHIGAEIADPPNEPGLVALYNFEGSFNGEVPDQTGNSNPVVLSAGSNIVPLLTVAEGDVANSSLLASDGNGDPLSYSVLTNASNGFVVVNPDGTFAYTPNPNYVGGDEFTLQVSDGQGGVTNQQIAVNVTTPFLNNTPPMGHGDSVVPSANFTGANSYVDVPPSLVNGMTAGTIETWVYLDSNTQARIFSQQANFTNTMALLSVENGAVTYKSHNGSGTITSSASLNTGEWHHIAVTFTAAEANLYIDGQHDSTLAGSGGIGFSIPPVTESLVNNASIGALIWDGGQQYMDGQLAEFRIWDTARTAQQIADNYLVQADGAESGLRALYDFSDPITNGDPVTDHAGTFDGVSHDVDSDIASIPGFGDSIDSQNAFAFDGTNAVYIDHNAALDPGNGSLTVEAWFYWAGSAATNDLDYLVSKGNTQNSDDIGYSILIDDDTLLVRTATLDPGSKGESEISLTGLNEGWHHVAMVIDQSGATSEIRGYLDGDGSGWSTEPGYSSTFNNGAITTAEPLALGARSDGLGENYEGALDDVRVWNTARSEAEIQQSMTRELTGGENGLVGYWTFNENSGNTVLDSSVNGIHGTVTGDDGRENMVDFSVSSAGNYKGLLLGGDVDGDHLSYAIAAGPDHGSLNLDGKTFVYSHDGSPTGHDTFTVEISDGTDTITQHIDVTVV